MQILYDNKLIGATVTATNENSSYPVANLTDDFLSKIFKPTGDTKVTIEFNIDTAISAIAVGLHSVSTGVYTLKNSGGTTLLTGSLVLSETTDFTYFTETTCRSIELDFTGTDLYVGGVSAGIPIEVERWNINPRFDYVSGDTRTRTRGGQVYGYKTGRYLRYRATVGDVSTTLRKELWAMLAQVGESDPIYMDFYEDSHDEIRPIYCYLEGDSQYVRDSGSQDYSTTLVFTEAK